MQVGNGKWSVSELVGQRQTVVFNRVKGRSVAFGTVLALDGQTVGNVQVKRDGSGYVLSASVDGVQKTFSPAASRIPAFERKTPAQIEAAALSAEKRNRNRQSRLKDRCKLTDYFFTGGSGRRNEHLDIGASTSPCRT